MLERLGPYVLASPVGDAVAIETRDATARGDDGRARPVRLDVLRVGDALTKTMSERFAEDAKAAAGLGHDALVRLLDHGIDAGFAYVVYEPYAHRTLAQLLDGSESGRLAPGLVAALASDVAAGLVNSHGLRPALVHRGISPRTVRVDARGRARLHGHALSGLAQEIARARGAAWEHLGYLSPEIVQDAPITERTDLFSLGSTLYEALCGRPAFEGPNPLATSIRLRMGSYDSLDEVAPELPAELRALIGHLLSAEPAKRPLAGAVRDTLSGLTQDASALRKSVAASVAPPARTPPMPSVKTEPMPAVSIPGLTPEELFADATAPTDAVPLADSVEPPALHLKLEAHDPSVFGEVAEPTVLDQHLPPLAASPHDYPTFRDPPGPPAASGRETAAQVTPTMPDDEKTDLAITVPPGAEERTILPLVTLPPSNLESPVARRDPPDAPRESQSLWQRLGLEQSGWPLALVIAFAVAAVVVVTLTALVAAWAAS